MTADDFRREAERANKVGDVNVRNMCLEAAGELEEMAAELAELREVSQAPMLMGLAAGQDAELRAHVSQLEAELAELRANPPKPAAVIIRGKGEWHGYESSEDANNAYIGDIAAHKINQIHSWIWHPRAETKA
jgi:hypothetical protein